MVDYKWEVVCGRWKVVTQNKTLWGLSSYHHISMEIVWTNYYSTISLWPPTNSGAKKSASFTGFRISINTCTFFRGLCSHRPVCLKKGQPLEVFCSSPFGNLKFGISKVNLAFQLLVFLEYDKKNCVLPFFGPPIHTSFVGKLTC